MAMINTSVLQNEPDGMREIDESKRHELSWSTGNFSLEGTPIRVLHLFPAECRSSACGTRGVEHVTAAGPVINMGHAVRMATEL